MTQNGSETPMVVKTVRMPGAMVDAIKSAGHPGGRSGVVREAVQDWLRRREAAQLCGDDLERALQVVTHVVRARINAVNAAAGSPPRRSRREARRT